MQQGEGVFRLDDDLFAQPAQAHSTCKLLHGNSIIQERRRKVEIGVVSSVADDQVIGVDIDAEIFDQVSLSPLRGWILDREQTVLYQNGDPVQNRIVWTVQIQNFQVFRIKTVTIDKAVTQRGYSPFFGEFLSFRAVEAQPEVIILLTQSKGWRLYDLFGAMI